VNLQFLEQHVPAAVELVGILESRTPVGPVITDPTARPIPRGTSGKVHIFRLRVPVRNIDPDAS
jgi:hypothetical protein